MPSLSLTYFAHCFSNIGGLRPHEEISIRLMRRCVDQHWGQMRKRTEDHVLCYPTLGVSCGVTQHPHEILSHPGLTICASLAVSSVIMARMRSRSGASSTPPPELHLHSPPRVQLTMFFLDSYIAYSSICLMVEYLPGLISECSESPTATSDFWSLCARW